MFQGLFEPQEDGTDSSNIRTIISTPEIPTPKTCYKSGNQKRKNPNDIDFV